MIEVKVPEECALLSSGEISVVNHITEADYEVALDTLASMTGMMYACCNRPAVRDRLKWLVEMLYHLSTAVRLDYTLTDEETESIIGLGRMYEEDRVEGITLPLSLDKEACYSHLARCKTREIILMLRKLQKEIEIDQRLFDVMDSLANFYYCYAVSITEGKLHVFNSRSY